MIAYSTKSNWNNRNIQRQFRDSANAYPYRAWALACPWQWISITIEIHTTVGCGMHAALAAAWAGQCPCVSVSGMPMRFCPDWVYIRSEMSKWVNSLVNFRRNNTVIYISFMWKKKPFKERFHWSGKHYVKQMSVKINSIQHETVKSLSSPSFTYIHFVQINDFCRSGSRF